MSIAIYQKYYNVIQCNHMYNFSKCINAENNSSIHDVVLQLYKDKKLRSNYIGIFNYDFKRKHQLILNENKITDEYDMYIAPLIINKKHSVFKSLHDKNPYLKETLIALLDYLNLPLDLKPQLGIYDNSVITTKEIYKDYIKNYLEPSFTFLKIRNVSNNIKNLLLDSIWSIYYEYNIEYIKLKVFRKSIISKKYLYTIFDNSNNNIVKQNTLKTFNFDTIILQKINDELIFNSNVISEMIDLNTIHDETDKIFYNYILNNNNYIITDYKYIIHSNDIKILNFDIEKYLNISDILLSNINQIHVLNIENVNVIFGKSIIMKMYFNSLVNMNNTYKSAFDLLKKKGIKINYI